MEFLDAVFNRRTTNGPFRPDPVSPEHQQTLIRAAAAAPSQFNSQPWRFVLIEDRDTIETVATISGESMTEVMSSVPSSTDTRSIFGFRRRKWTPCAAACFSTSCPHCSALSRPARSPRPGRT